MAEKKARRAKRAPKKREVPVEKGDNIPEVFDSNKYDSMSEMTDSATMESGEARQVLSEAKRQERLSPGSTKAKTLPKNHSGVNPSLDEHAEALRHEQARGDESLQGYRSA